MFYLLQTIIYKALRSLSIFALVLSTSVLFVTQTHAVSSTTPIVTIGDGTDAASTNIGPGASATNSDSFTLRTSTTTSTVTNALINLNAGGKNDGATWATSSAANNSWSSVAYGNGLYVAVAATSSTNSVMTSPDGITWTVRSAVAKQWQSVTYGNGLFVAVSCGTVCGDSGTNIVMTSPDGITWTSRTGASDLYWSSVTFGNDLFVAVSYFGGVMTSTDRTCGQ